MSKFVQEELEAISDHPAASSNSEMARMMGEAESYLSLTAEAEAMDEASKALRAKARTILEQTLPQLMDEIGCPSFETTMGHKITVGPFTRAAIPKKTEEKAFEWLRKNGQGDLIKTLVTARFAAGKDKAAAAAVKTLEKFGVAADVKNTVHAGTLTAWVKKELEKDPKDRVVKKLPEDLLGIYSTRMATVKPPKD